MLGQELSYYLTIIPGILIALMVHEVSHGLAAYVMGDNTAKDQGRLSMNPLKHIDPIGFLCMLVAGFGWAKPVPVNLSNLRNRKMGMVLTAAAGPLSNFILAFFCILIAFFIQVFAINVVFLVSMGNFLITTASLSVGLGIFNLIPVPPLDGSNIIFPFLPAKVKEFYYNYGQYIQFALMALLIFNFLDGFLIFGRSVVLGGIANLAQAVVSLFV